MLSKNRSFWPCDRAQSELLPGKMAVERGCSKLQALQQRRHCLPSLQKVGAVSSTTFDISWILKVTAANMNNTPFLLQTSASSPPSLFKLPNLLRNLPFVYHIAETIIPFLWHADRMIPFLCHRTPSRVLANWTNIKCFFFPLQKSLLKRTVSPTKPLKQETNAWSE